jgi:PAS domain S-box-containing protein
VINVNQIIKTDGSTMRFNNQLIDLPNLYHAMDQCPLTISPDTYVVDAIILMNQERSINYLPTDSNELVNNREICRSNTCILVVEGGHLLGIFTTKDVLRVTANRINLSEVKIAEVMVQPVITLTPSNSQDIFTALSLLRQHQIRHLPILDQQGQLLGLVTETTLLKTIDKINGVNLVEICPLTGESTNQPSDPIGCQTHTYLKKWLDAQTAELMAINEELQQTLEELQMVEEELRQQNEELGVAREIAELERERYQDLFNFAPHGYLVSDATGVIQEANHAAATLLGVQQNHLVGKPLILFIAEQERQNFIIQLQTLDRVDDWEIHLQPRNGRPFPASVKAAGIYNSQGQRMGWRWLLCDITPRKQVEAKLCQASEELEIRVLERTNELSTANQLLDIATDAILVIDFESTILFWNKGAERIYGWQAQEAVGKKPEDLFYKKTSPQLKAALKTALQTLTESGSWQGELTRFTQSGQEIIVESRWTLMYDPAGQPTSILSVDTDVTEKKQLEDQFLRAQRLESLGTLAGGIAHDLNNILTPILAASQLLQMKCPQNKEHYHNLLAIIESNTKRGAALVKQVLSFARGFRGEPTIVQLKHIITEITQIAQQTFPKSIKFAITIPKDLWAVLGDATQLHQVLMNLVVNARDAMPTGGMVTISAKNMLIDEAYARMNLDAQVGYYVVMTVADTGMGIPPEILDKIFDPFFTTKPVGKGTGLGLSTVLGIIKSHGGFINVSSIVQQGSKFELFLPAVEVTQSLEINNLEIFPGNGELILFVDDEAEIREIAKIVLEKHNYRILTASNGIEAIALYAQYKQDISVVLMDIMMPEMDGITAIRTLQKMNPQVLIIACSGINSQEALANANITLVLSKPYTTPDLLYSLHHILTNRMGLEAPPSRTAF